MAEAADVSWHSCMLLCTFRGALPPLLGRPPHGATEGAKHSHPHLVAWRKVLVGWQGVTKSTSLDGVAGGVKLFDVEVYGNCPFPLPATTFHSLPAPFPAMIRRLSELVTRILQFRSAEPSHLLDDGVTTPDNGDSAAVPAAGAGASLPSSKRRRTDGFAVSGLTSRQHSGSAPPLCLRPDDAVSMYKVCYLYSKKRLAASPVVALLHMRVPRAARVYQSETGAPVDLSLPSPLPEGMKLACSKALVLEAKFLGDTDTAVSQALDEYEAGQLILVPQFWLHQPEGSRPLLTMYEVGEVSVAEDAGTPGKNGCVAGIHGFGTEMEAFQLALQACANLPAATEQPPAFMMALSKAYAGGAEPTVEPWYRWNTVAAPAGFDKQATGDGDEHKEEQEREEAVDTASRCFCCQALGAELKLASCGHGAVCKPCGDALFGSPCPVCAHLVKRTSAWNPDGISLSSVFANWGSGT